MSRFFSLEIHLLIQHVLGLSKLETMLISLEGLLYSPMGTTGPFLKEYMEKFWAHRRGVSIGNNVFIGMQSTILKGVHIGNNVIIGANSLVNKDIPNNCVAAGNPCKVIMSLAEYYEKRKAAQVQEASELVRLYRERYGKEPDEKALHEFFGYSLIILMSYLKFGSQ